MPPPLLSHHINGRSSVDPHIVNHGDGELLEVLGCPNKRRAFVAAPPGDPSRYLRIEFPISISKFFSLSPFFFKKFFRSSPASPFVDIRPRHGDLLYNLTFTGYRLRDPASPDDHLGPKPRKKKNCRFYSQLNEVPVGLHNEFDFTDLAAEETSCDRPEGERYALARWA